MSLSNRVSRAAQAIFDAESNVERAMLDYRKGGSTKAINDANRELADCHARYREVSGGRIPNQR